MHEDAGQQLLAQSHGRFGQVASSSGTTVPWTDLESTRRVLEGCHAFVDPTQADDRGIRLRLPAQSPE